MLVQTDCVWYKENDGEPTSLASQVAVLLQCCCDLPMNQFGIRKIGSRMPSDKLQHVFYFILTNNLFH